MLGQNLPTIRIWPNEEEKGYEKPSPLYIHQVMVLQVGVRRPPKSTQKNLDINTIIQRRDTLGLALRTFRTLDRSPKLFGGERKDLPAGQTLTDLKIRFVILVNFTREQEIKRIVS